MRQIGDRRLAQEVSKPIGEHRSGDPDFPGQTGHRPRLREPLVEDRQRAAHARVAGPRQRIVANVDLEHRRKSAQKRSRQLRFTREKAADETRRLSAAAALHHLQSTGQKHRQRGEGIDRLHLPAGAQDVSVAVRKRDDVARAQPDALTVFELDVRLAVATRKAVAVVCIALVVFAAFVPALASTLGAESHRSCQNCAS